MERKSDRRERGRKFLWSRNLKRGILLWCAWTLIFFFFFYLFFFLFDDEEAHDCGHITCHMM